LRAQYADDVSKLTMLVEAHRLFDPRRPEVQAPGNPSLFDGPAGVDGPPVDATAELRAAKARLAELTGYLEELERDLPELREKLERAQETEARAAAEVDSATAHAVTPYLAQRDALARRREDAVAAIQRAVSGLRLVQSLERRADHVARQESLAQSLREELATETSDRLRPDRAAVIARVGERYRQILADWRYPKLADAYLADDLTPFVRADPYQLASAGGRTLIALAWQLAMFEVAWETGSSHPGFLMLDSPQKNLGRADERDAEFADSATVADIYRHLHGWLAGPGAGAQIVVADNVPPEMAEPDVIVRFSRRPDQPPYGLIDDETS
jgi:DNA repair exonuclease SbcCD ATPase subunit